MNTTAIPMKTPNKSARFPRSLTMLRTTPTLLPTTSPSFSYVLTNLSFSLRKMEVNSFFLLFISAQHCFELQRLCERNQLGNLRCSGGHNSYSIRMGHHQRKFIMPLLHSLWMAIFNLQCHLSRAVQSQLNSGPSMCRSCLIPLAQAATLTPSSHPPCCAPVPLERTPARVTPAARSGLRAAPLSLRYGAITPMLAKRKALKLINALKIKHGIVSWGYGCAAAGYPG